MSIFASKILSLILVPFLATSSFFAGLAGQGQTFGASLPQAPAVFETSLLSAITQSATTMILNANSVRGGSSLSGFNCFTIDEGSAQREDVCGTVSGTTVSSMTRGIDPISGTTTNATLQFQHRRGAQVKITDFPVIQIMRNQLAGADTIPRPIFYASGVSPSTADDLTDKGYVDGLAFSSIITGANFPNSNTLVWYDGTNLRSTTTNPLFVGAIVATSTTATSSVAQALGIATTSPWTKLALGAGAVTVVEQRLSTSTNMTVDWRTSNTQLLQTGVSATTIGFTGFVAGQQLKLIVCNPGSTAGAITFTGVDWVGGALPTQSTATSTCDVWSFLATQATSTQATSSLKIFGAVTNGFQ